MPEDLRERIRPGMTCWLVEHHGWMSDHVDVVEVVVKKVRARTVWCDCAQVGRHWHNTLKRNPLIYTDRGAAYVEAVRLLQGHLDRAQAKCERITKRLRPLRDEVIKEQCTG